MVKLNRLVGGVLLVSGTAIGAGMLALPVFSGFGGFFPSLLLLGITWLFMFYTAWLFLQVNLATPGESNMISMAGRSLGVGGKAVCWVAYLLLLYSLLSAYIAGSAPILLEIVQALFGLEIPSTLGPLIMLILFGVFVYLGTRLVDWINRLLMIGLIATYFLLVVFLPSHVDVSLLAHIDLRAAPLALPVLFTSFGFHIVIPSLTTYLLHDRRKLFLAIFIGSLIPLFVYMIWELLVLGIVPLPMLADAFREGQSAAVPLTALLSERLVASAAHAFAFFAIITSFLGVSLSLSDFLADGLKLKRHAFGREVACILTFVPPLLFVYFYPRGFLLALEFAGIFVAILLGILPALMASRLSAFKSKLRRAGIYGAILFSLLIIVIDILDRTGQLKLLISHVST